MSFDALAWAARQNTGSAGTKLVLLGLAECAHRDTGNAFPSIAALVEFSSMDRKSVIANLARLEAGGFISDTGERVGHTKQIKVYRLNLQSIPKQEPSQKRNSSVSSRNSPKNGTRNQLEPVSSEAKASSQRVAPAKPKRETGELARPDDVTEEVWSDWRKHRKAKKAQISASAMAAIRREATKAGWEMDAALTEAMARGWTGFKAEWVEPRQPRQAGPAPPGDFLAHLLEQQRQREDWERRQASANHKAA